MITNFYNQNFKGPKRCVKRGVWKVALLLATLYSGQLHAKVQEQITISSKNLSLEQVLSLIKKESGYDFLYSSKDIDLSRKITKSYKNQTLRSVLDELLNKGGYEYEIDNKTILIKRKRSIAGDESSVSSSSRQQKYTGKVLNVHNRPISGATVSIKGSDLSTSTDDEGYFELSPTTSHAVLMVSAVGYSNHEENMEGRLTANIVLEEVITGLDEVVVVGYGTQKKINLTGSVATVSGEELENRPVANATQSLQGVMPGLNVSVNGNTKPGQSFELNVRGQGNLSGSDAPYVLVDGMEMSLADVNPGDIESISVLKDASAGAIYGSRAAYGVILVTTKKGSAGRKVINLTSNVGFTSPVMLPQMANSVEFANFFNTATFNALGTQQYSEEKIALLEQYIRDPNSISIFPEVNSNNYGSWENSANGVANTNWFDLHYKPFGLRQNYNLNLSGGNAETQYFVSGGYYGDGGVLRFADIDYKRYNFNTSVQSQLNKVIKVKANVKYTNGNSTSPLAGFEDMFFHNLARMRPNVSPYDFYGNWNEQSIVPYLQSGSNAESTAATLALLGGLEITPLDNWKIFVDLNFKQVDFNSSTLKLPGTIYGIDGEPILVNRSEYNIPIAGSYGREMRQTNYLSPNIYTNYKTSFGAHNFDITAGFQQEVNTYKMLNSSVSDLISFDRPGINLGSGTKLANEERNHWATRGFFGRMSYNYNNKYLLELNGRYDGSSRFASDQRWGFFPSVSAGYNISEESWMREQVSWIDALKIRGSYGTLGNQAGANIYAYSENMETVVPGLGSGGRYYFGDGRESYIQAPGAFNPLITWEKVASSNVGLDFAVLQHKLSGSIEVYQRNTKDMLGPSRDVADMYGADAPQSNNADLRTRGWELSFKWKDKIGDHVSYFVGIMATDYKSVVTKYQNETNFNPGGAWYEGKTVGEIWGYRSNGLLQTDADVAAYNQLDRSFISAREWVKGDVKYEDINGDGKINNGSNRLEDMGDMYIIGNSGPRYAYSINAGASWKGFDMSMLWQGIGKSDFSPPTLDAYFWGSGSLAQVVVFKQHLDYYTEDNPDAYYPNPYAAPVGAIGSYTNKTQLPSSQYLQSAAYLRLKNLTLQYTIPTAITSRYGISRLALYGSGENLLTFTKLADMFDPETTVGGAAPGKIYPLSKVYSFGINLTF